MKIRPTRDIILIKSDKPRTQTASGIYITEEWKTLPPTGTVESVGPAVENIKPGMRVLFERYTSIVLPKDENGDEYRLCKEVNILGEIIDEENRN